MSSGKSFRYKFKTLFGLVLISGSALCVSHAYAAKDQVQDKIHDQHEDIEVTQQNVTLEELAAIHVFSEVCPALLKKGQNFDSGYALLVKDYLPNEKNPTASLQKMSQQAAFKNVLTEARADAKKAGEQANRDICQDIVNYQPYK